jgi:hypothetical protein
MNIGHNVQTQSPLWALQSEVTQNSQFHPIPMLFEQHMYNVAVHSWNQFQVIQDTKNFLDLERKTNSILQSLD